MEDDVLHPVSHATEGKFPYSSKAENKSNDTVFCTFDGDRTVVKIYVHKLYDIC
jgi:hypothetical protein